MTEFKREPLPHFKSLDLPRRACECAPVYQEDGKPLLMLVDGVSHRLDERAARHMKLHVDKFLANLKE